MNSIDRIVLRQARELFLKNAKEAIETGMGLKIARLSWNGGPELFLDVEQVGFGEAALNIIDIILVLGIEISKIGVLDHLQVLASDCQMELRHRRLEMAFIVSELQSFPEQN